MITSVPVTALETNVQVSLNGPAILACNLLQPDATWRAGLCLQRRPPFLGARQKTSLVENQHRIGPASPEVFLVETFGFDCGSFPKSAEVKLVPGRGGKFGRVSRFGAPGQHCMDQVFNAVEFDAKLQLGVFDGQVNEELLKLSQDELQAVALLLAKRLKGTSEAS
jgi:hypothetical protein